MRLDRLGEHALPTLMRKVVAFAAEGLPFHPVWPAPGHTMSADVYYEFWEALGDQEELVYVVTSVSCRRQGRAGPGGPGRR